MVFFVDVIVFWRIHVLRVINETNRLGSEQTRLCVRQCGTLREMRTGRTVGTICGVGQPGEEEQDDSKARWCF